MRQAGCSSYAFWLDPICVPLNSAWKFRALEKMDEVYKHATKVFVIDRDIIRCQGSKVFRRIAILMSDWITRIWTFQEAILPGERLYVAWADGVKSVDTIIMDGYKDNSLSSRALIVHTSESARLRTSLGKYGKNFIDLVEAFSRRQTTNLEDEYICLAILLDIDIRKVLDSPTMHSIVSQLSSTEQDIIFAPGSRCTQVGYRWCPSSIVAAERKKTYEPKQKPGLLGLKGIQVQKDIAMFGSLEFQGLTLRSRDAEKQHLLLDGWMGSSPLSIVVVCEKGLGATAAQLQPRLLRNVGLIFEKQCDISNEPGAAILVSDLQMEDDCFCCRYECFVMSVNRELFSKYGGLPAGDTVAIDVEFLRGTKVWID